MHLNIIVAICQNLGIGFKGQLPWQLKNELKFFASTTKKVTDPQKVNAVIMGRRTFFGIPASKRPLPGRINIVLSRNPQAEDYPSDVILCKSLKEALERLEQADLKIKVENVWIVGGSSVYEEAMGSPLCHRLYVTEVHNNFECDTFFPEIPKAYKVISSDDVPQGVQEENGVKYEYKVYERQ